MIGKLDRRRCARRSRKAASPILQARPDSNGKVGAVGFCWGGGMVNALAVAEPGLGAGVAYYGGQPEAEDVPKIKAAMLLHYAGLDERINAGIPAYEEALKEAGKTYEIYVYEGVNHAFNNDTNAARYNKAAADLAWSRTVAFLKKYAGGSAWRIAPLSAVLAIHASDLVRKLSKNLRVVSSLTVPSASMSPGLSTMYISGWAMRCRCRVGRIERSMSCAIAVPTAPGVMPAMAAGFPDHEFLPHGLVPQSIAFLMIGVVERLYSGVTNSTASDASISFFLSSSTCGLCDFPRGLRCKAAGRATGN